MRFVGETEDNWSAVVVGSYQLISPLISAHPLSLDSGIWPAATDTMYD